METLQFINLIFLFLIIFYLSLSGISFRLQCTINLQLVLVSQGLRKLENTKKEKTQHKVKVGSVMVSHSGLCSNLCTDDSPSQAHRILKDGACRLLSFLPVGIVGT